MNKGKINFKYWKNICLWIIAALLFYSGIQNYASMEESNAAVIELYGTYPDQKRAEEILSLVEKTEYDLSSNNSQIGGEIIIGGNPTITVLNTAARLRSKYPDVHFQFYSSDAIDVLERLEHGSIDFAVFGTD